MGKSLLAIPAETATIDISLFIEMLQKLKDCGEEVFCVVYHSSDAGILHPEWGDEVWFVTEKQFEKLMPISK